MYIYIGLVNAMKDNGPQSPSFKRIPVPEVNIRFHPLIIKCNSQRVVLGTSTISRSNKMK